MAKHFPQHYPHTLPVPPDSSTSNPAAMLWPNHQETTHSSSSTRLVNIKPCSHTVAKPSGDHLSVLPKLMTPPPLPTHTHYQTARLQSFPCTTDSLPARCHGDYFPWPPHQTFSIHCPTVSLTLKIKQLSRDIVEKNVYVYAVHVALLPFKKKEATALMNMAFPVLPVLAFGWSV